MTLYNEYNFRTQHLSYKAYILYPVAETSYRMYYVLRFIRVMNDEETTVSIINSLFI